MPGEGMTVFQFLKISCDVSKLGFVAQIGVVRSLVILCCVIVRSVGIIAVSAIPTIARIIISWITRTAIAKRVATVSSTIPSSARVILIPVSAISVTSIMYNCGVTYPARTSNGLTTSKAPVPYRTSADIESAVVMKSSVAAAIAIINCRVAVIKMSY